MDNRPSNIFDPDFEKEERFFHYTSPAGLYGILESGCLWATHYRFLNDERELFRARPVIVDAVRGAILAQAAAMKVDHIVKFEEGANLRELSLGEAETIVDTMYISTLGATDRSIRGIGHPYVFSAFCCAPNEAEDFGNGALVHWGTYGKAGGYALQINPHTIKTLLDLESKRIGNLGSMSRKVSYLGGGQPPKEVTDWTKPIANVAKKIVEARLLGQELDKIDVGETLRPFISAICFTKDAFFAPEREARIVVIQPHEHMEKVGRYELQVRQSSGITVPYVKLFDGLLFKECPVERILIGPHLNNEKRAIALSAFLKNRGLGHIEVAISTVPYITQLG